MRLYAKGLKLFINQLFLLLIVQKELTQKRNNFMLFTSEAMTCKIW